MTAETRKELETLFKPQIEFINGLSKTILPAINFYSSLPNLENAIGISQIANSIVMPTIPLIQQVSSIAPMISNLGQNVIELGSLFQKISASTQLISSLANNLGSVFNQASKLSDYFKPAQFYATLPNLTEINQIWVEIKEGGEAFKQAGFGFIAGEYVSVKTVLRFASVNPRIRSALITNQMAAEARSQEFEQELKKIFLQSSVLRRRWHIVEQVIRAHRRREYNIAVPAVLAQVEGIIGDALILNVSSTQKAEHQNKDT